jgi:trans-aconitate methyltransferase
MSLYDTDDGVDQYVAMRSDTNGAAHVDRLKELLPEGAQVLELGMGPGVDFDLLRHYFSVLGTDTSFVFLERYQDKHPGADLLELDARTLKTTRTFDGIYSNKVLHHLTRAELDQSFRRQLDRLLPGAVALHTFWYGNCAPEEKAGMLFTYHTEDSLQALIPDGLNVESVRRYCEIEDDDSIELVLRKPRAPSRVQLRSTVR